MSLFLYDTLSKSKREFIPLKDKTVKLYTCGLTVYNYGHIGNFSHYIFVDFLKNYLKFLNYKVTHVRNITDVGHLVDDADSGEDKMLKAAKVEGKDPWQIAAFYTEAFHRDCEILGLSVPDVEPKATEHIAGMIQMIEQLIEKGIAYKAADGVYFSVESWGKYGELSGNKVDALIAGARVEVNPNKKHPADFALWKTDQPHHVMLWDSPWGRGYPGWHIECSAMSKEYLGEELDIHTGGEDNIFPHHECEIAQSEGVSGKKFVNFWLHKRHLLIGGEKMSKSKGNVYTLASLYEAWQKQGFLGTPAQAAHIFKFLVLSAHYRSQLDFTFENLAAAYKSWERLDQTYQRIRAAMVNDSLSGIRPDLEQFSLHFYQSLDDDLNTPNALGALFSYSNVVNTALDGDGLSPVEQEHALSLFQNFFHLFQISLDTQTITAEEKVLIEEREQARLNKDWPKSDQLRDQLLTMGVEVKDGKGGVSWKKKLM